MARFTVSELALVTALLVGTAGASADLELWKSEFPRTDFTRTQVPLAEIEDDGNYRDTISPIDDPVFQPVNALTAMGPLEPMLSLIIAGDARAYPLRMLLWHEIVNDTVGGVLATARCAIPVSFMTGGSKGRPWHSGTPAASGMRIW
jgi:hypothetical protein